MRTGLSQVAIGAVLAVTIAMLVIDHEDTVTVDNLADGTRIPSRDGAATQLPASDSLAWTTFEHVWRTQHDDPATQYAY
ncbi:MAG: hypothetical protein M3N23_01510 [Pseudomonadota bacterium]|nr:hypothetical protein [Pseudomonadota bacterium]